MSRVWPYFFLQKIPIQQFQSCYYNDAQIKRQMSICQSTQLTERRNDKPLAGRTNDASRNQHVPLARCVQLRVTHVPGMPGTLSPPPQDSDPGMHHGKCVTHVPRCTPRSLTNDFLRSRWWGKRSRHSQRMHNPQFYVSGMRPVQIAVPTLLSRQSAMNRWL